MGTEVDSKVQDVSEHHYQLRMVEVLKHRRFGKLLKNSRESLADYLRLTPWTMSLPWTFAAFHWFLLLLLRAGLWDVGKHGFSVDNGSALGFAHYSKLGRGDVRFLDDVSVYGRLLGVFTEVEYCCARSSSKMCEFCARRSKIHEIVDDDER
jgi:hypothetical protein